MPTLDFHGHTRCVLYDHGRDAPAWMHLELDVEHAHTVPSIAVHLTHHAGEVLENGFLFGIPEVEDSPANTTCSAP